ncbi:MAG: helix-turn-helix domain-containing protein [Stenotrophomonas sp.]
MQASIQHHQIQGSQGLDLSLQRGERIHAITGRGRGNRLFIPAGWISATLVLDGSLDLINGATPWKLASRRVQLWTDGSLRHFSPQHSWWLCVAAPATMWQRPLRSTASIINHLIPREMPCDVDLARLMVQLCRARWFKGADSAPAGDMLRVQHLIRCNVDSRLGMTSLAAAANYSPTHLIRVYREVFGETPSEYAARLRNQRAWDLVCDSNAPICEISEQLGFESESAFCRAFKHSFGCTTTAARRRQVTPTPALRRVAAEPAPAAQKLQDEYEAAVC